MKPTLQKFAHQLASWTNEIIDRGRTPFRRVETCTRIETEVGPVELALIFWINRQSLMAGGLVILPENGIERDLERGYHAAQALGLSHFVTWEKNQVRIWHCQPTGTIEQQAFELKDPDYLETFRFVLEDLLEALKLTAVLGAIPPHGLSIAYFHNLAQITLQQTQPSLVETYRSHRSGDGHNLKIDIDTCAQETNRQILLQILALLWLGNVPKPVMPENLQQALASATVLLPENISTALAIRALEDAPELPLEASVAFHHFLLRLKQLSWDNTDDRIRTTLTRLAQRWFPLDNHSDGKIYIYPLAPPGNQAELVLSESPSLLSLTALLNHSDHNKAAQLQFNHIFKLGHEAFPLSTVTTRLLNSRALTLQDRGEIVTQLRNSWPHRRFKIRTGQPFWLWELVHLLGISHKNQQIDLLIPLAAVQTSANSYIWSLLSKHFCLQRLTTEGENLWINLKRHLQGETSVEVQYSNETREITPTDTTAQLRSKLLLALELPKEIYALLDHELVWVTHTSKRHNRGLQIYQKTRCHQWIKAILSPNQLALPNQDGADLNIETSLLQPESTFLEQLSNEQNSTDQQSKKSVDQLLADILFCPSLATLELPERPQRVRQLNKKTPERNHQRSLLLQNAEVFGIPNFPEKYLYFLKNPEIKTYQIAPPLIQKSRILGEFTLEDADGQVINGFGEELEQALLICSQLRKTNFELPEARAQLNLMLERYKKDLNTLYDHLATITYSQHENAREAGKLLGQAWKKLHLPTPPWFKG